MAEIPAETAAKVARAGVPMWAKALVVASVGLMVAGVVVPLVAADKTVAVQRTTGGVAPAGGAGVTGLMEGPPSEPGPAVVESKPSGLAAWSPTVFALGFSFFVGFAIAYALRMFLRFAVIGLGFFFLLMFGLQYAGLVEVRWAAMEEKYDQITSGMEKKAKSATDYMTAYLPSAASGTAGLVAGFWRRR